MRAPLPGERPLLRLTAAALERQFVDALHEGNGVDGAHCIHELWMRGAMPTNITRMLEALWHRAADSIPDWLPMRYIEWLPLAYEVAARFQPQVRRRGSRGHNLYLVLLDYSDASEGAVQPFGVYVGQSRYSPLQRFDQHKAGIRASGSVTRRGLEVLLGPVLHLQQLPRGEAETVEERLAEALRAEGLRVKGGH